MEILQFSGQNQDLMEKINENFEICDLNLRFEEIQKENELDFLHKSLLGQKNNQANNVIINNNQIPVHCINISKNKLKQQGYNVKKKSSNSQK